jgi:hypothetical protein
MSCANTINKLSYETCKLINNKNDIAAQLRITNLNNLEFYGSFNFNNFLLSVNFNKIKTIDKPEEFIYPLVEYSSLDILNALGLVIPFFSYEIEIDFNSETLKYDIIIESNKFVFFNNTQKIISIINKKQSNIYWTDYTLSFANLKSLNSIKLNLKIIENNSYFKNITLNNKNVLKVNNESIKNTILKFL